MYGKSDTEFELTLKRFDAWWHQEIVDRLPVSIHLPVCEAPDLIPSRHNSLKDRWLDVEFNVENAIRTMRVSQYCGDSYPRYMPNIGPELAATLLGCALEFSETTSWSIPMVHAPDDWNNLIQRQPDFNTPYYQAIEAMTRYAIERADGNFIVSVADIHGNFDNLASFRDPEALCMDLFDCPDTIEKAARKMPALFKETFNRLWSIIREADMPCSTWSGHLSTTSSYLPSCDFWCMVSDQIARDLILPDILDEMSVIDLSLFHLDGPDALRHLDILLEIDHLNAVQWVYGAGNGPASRWTDIYKRMLNAGKSIQIQVESPQDALDVVRETGQKGVWVSGVGLNTSEDASSFLNEISSL